MPSSAPVVVHLSDLHFGREDRRVVEALHNAVWTLEPAVVAVSGDLTQRARQDQFRRARAFLDRLPPPRLVVPGNHDVPLFNLAARMFSPLGNYRRYITADLEPTLADGHVWVAGVNTTRPRRWKSGGLDAAAIARVRESLRHAPAAAVKLLVAHHPFEVRDGHTSPSAALSELVDAGIDVFLTGHMHITYAGHTALRYDAGQRSAVVVEAGTATSTRLRDERNAFNVLRIGANAIDVEVWSWDGARFSSREAQRFSKTSDSWALERNS